MLCFKQTQVLPPRQNISYRKLLFPPIRSHRLLVLVGFLSKGASGVILFRPTEIIVGQNPENFEDPSMDAEEPENRPKFTIYDFRRADIWVMIAYIHLSLLCIIFFSGVGLQTL